MVFSGMEVMNEVPFKYIYVHGLVRDAQGRKMSKSLGNGTDPLELIDKYGADALRFIRSFPAPDPPERKGQTHVERRHRVPSPKHNTVET